jgi:hypothetical protein
MQLVPERVADSPLAAEPQDVRRRNYGMREFAIYDNNGYMLQFGTPTRG